MTRGGPATSFADHLRSAFGDEFEVALDRDGIEVLVFADEDDGEVVLATIGMAQLAGARARRGTELIMFAERQHQEQLARVLVDLAHYPSHMHTQFGWLHLVKIGFPVVEGSRLDSLLLTFPSVGKKGFSSFQRSPNSMRIDVIQVIPISETERKLCEVEGCERFEELLEQSDVSIIDMFREVVV